MLKQQAITITAEGRDKGKVFLLTEMPAMAAEKWAARALLALIEGGVQLPDEIASGGMAALMSEPALEAIFASLLGGLGRIDWAKVEPLLDEMMTRVRVVPDPAGNPDFTRALNAAAGDIEEVPTLLKLRAELIKLHTGFSLAVGPSKSTPPTASRVAPITKMSRR